MQAPQKKSPAKTTSAKAKKGKEKKNTSKEDVPEAKEESPQAIASDQEEVSAKDTNPKASSAEGTTLADKEQGTVQEEAKDPEQVPTEGLAVQDQPMPAITQAGSEQQMLAIPAGYMIISEQGAFKLVPVPTSQPGQSQVQVQPEVQVQVQPPMQVQPAVQVQSPAKKILIRPEPKEQEPASQDFANQFFVDGAEQSSEDETRKRKQFNFHLALC